MLQFILPVLFALFVWWAATLLMMKRSLSAPPRCGASMLFITVLALAGLAALLLTLDQPTVAGAYIGFMSGMALWAWHELSYFLGFVTGPRPAACTPGVGMAKRFSLGVQTSLYHELAIVLTAAALWWVSYQAANQVALWTFVLFWAMRWSAKLNIFLGVRNLHAEFWPEHLRYLETYVGKAGNNWLFPVSMTAAAVGLVYLLMQALAPGATGFERSFALLLSTMLGLAVLEHIFLVVPVPDAWLWRLAMQDDDKTPATAPVEWRPRPES